VLDILVAFGIMRLQLIITAQTGGQHEKGTNHANAYLDAFNYHNSQNAHRTPALYQARVGEVLYFETVCASGQDSCDS
jgi:hypothetical protein